MSKTQQIELAKISTEGLQTRAALNRATVKDYANAAHGLLFCFERNWTNSGHRLV